MYLCICLCVFMHACTCARVCVVSFIQLVNVFTSCCILQAVEFFAEWALCPRNVVFLRVQTGVFDPLLIGDKPKWYSQSLQKIDFHVYDENSSTLGAALATCLENQPSDDNPTGSTISSATNISSSRSNRVLSVYHPS